MPDGALTIGEDELPSASNLETEFRRRWYEAHRDRFVADEGRYKKD